MEIQTSLRSSKISMIARSVRRDLKRVKREIFVKLLSWLIFVNSANYSFLLNFAQNFSSSLIFSQVVMLFFEFLKEVWISVSYNLRFFIKLSSWLIFWKKTQKHWNMCHTPVNEIFCQVVIMVDYALDWDIRHSKFRFWIWFFSAEELMCSKSCHLVHF